MAGTLSSLTAAGGVALPAPVVHLQRNRVGFQPLVRDGGALTTLAVDTLNLASVSVHGLPQAVMDDLASFQPQLELLRYNRRRTQHVAFSRAFQTAAYVHPSHAPAPSGNGSHTHGGSHNLGAALAAIRLTEWPVLTWGQVIDVTQGVFGLLAHGRFEFRDASGTKVGVEGLYPTGSLQNRNFGKRFPYSGIFRPGYYKFRWSIIDPSDSRGQRITGPLSDTLSVSNAVFPFIPDDAFDDVPSGRLLATASLDPRHNSRLAQMWLGSVSRLPIG